MESSEFDNIPWFQKLLLFLSLYVVAELYISSTIDYSPEVRLILERIDFVICILFLYEFFTGIYRAESRWQYFKVHWIDLISSIPTVGALRAGRLVRIIRILRVLRSAKFVINYFNKNSSVNTFKNLMIGSVMVILLFTLSFYHLEKDVNPNITTIGDSLWWTTITTITVGFLQDIPPVTIEGKIFSVVLILLGMVIFSTLTGTITDLFIEDEDIVAKLDEVSAKMDDVDKKLADLNEKMDSLNKG